jgi:hypothetical protein
MIPSGRLRNGADAGWEASVAGHVNGVGGSQ